MYDVWRIDGDIPYPLYLVGTLSYNEGVAGKKRIELQAAGVRQNAEKLEAQVKIGEAATGLSEELSDVNLAVQRAHDKTEGMKARAAAIDELVEEGTLDAPTAGDPLEAELSRISARQGVESDFERLKKELEGK